MRFVLKQEGQRSLDGICDGQTTCMRPIEFISSGKVLLFQKPFPVQEVQQRCSCGSVVDHCVSSAKVVGSIPREHILTKNV